jgi:hypothetical protein
MREKKLVHIWGLVWIKYTSKGSVVNLICLSMLTTNKPVGFSASASSLMARIGGDLLYVSAAAS